MFFVIFRQVLNNTSINVVSLMLNHAFENWLLESKKKKKKDFICKTRYIDTMHKEIYRGVKI